MTRTCAIPSGRDASELGRDGVERRAALPAQLGEPVGEPIGNPPIARGPALDGAVVHLDRSGKLALPGRAVQGLADGAEEGGGHLRLAVHAAAQQLGVLAGLPAPQRSYLEHIMARLYGARVG